MKEGWTKKECVPHVVRTEDQGGGWYLDTLSDGSQRSYHREKTEEQVAFEREERQAWDRYAAAVLPLTMQCAVVLREQNKLPADMNAEQTAAYGAKEIADAMLAERRKRFQAPGADKGGAS